MAKYFNCPNCGLAIGYYSKECKECKSDLSDISTTGRIEVDKIENNISTSTLPSSKPKMNIVPLVIVFIVLIIGAVFYYQYKNVNQDSTDEVMQKPFRGMYIIPRPNENAKYFLKSHVKSGSYFIVEHVRVSPSNTGYSRTKIDCKEFLYMDLSYSDISFEDLDNRLYSNTSWTKPVRGSSKYDLVNTVCVILK